MVNEIKTENNFQKAGKRSSKTNIQNKGDGEDCANFRPIILLRIAYEIWPNLTTRKLAKKFYSYQHPKINTDIDKTPQQ